MAKGAFYLESNLKVLDAQQTKSDAIVVCILGTAIVAASEQKKVNKSSADLNQNAIYFINNKK